ncbi:MAG TPA: HDOD domain-containing protein [Tepidisphaeraceae bacterium]|nr:HDOD domain-containing protein [Tepidisphaeraceae bacterium]
MTWWVALIAAVVTLLLAAWSIGLRVLQDRRRGLRVDPNEILGQPQSPIPPIPEPTPTEGVVAITPEGARVRPADDAGPDELTKSRIVDDVLRGLEKIPPLPKAVHQVLRELNSVGSTAKSVATIVGTEPVLSASILRLVNSAAFGLRREICTVDQAVAYLGFSTVKSIVVRLKVGPLLGVKASPTGPRGYDGEKLWLHSLAVGQAAEHVAKRCGNVDPWLAGTIGLLHDIGKLAINATFPGSVEKLWDSGPTGDESFLARERRLFGADHAFIGGFLAAKWELPGDLVEAIRLHHLPADFQAANLSPELRRAIQVVHVANQLVKYRHVYCEDMEIDIVPPAVFAELGLPDDLEKVLDRQTKDVIKNAVRLAMPPPQARQARQVRQQVRRAA